MTTLAAGDGVPVLYPHVFAFPLQMVVVTHPAFPFPIWRMLQIRNHLVLHRPLPPDALVDVETRVVSDRILERGVEVDVRTEVRSGEGLLWEGLVTFYFRGRAGTPGVPSPLARAPAVGGDVEAEWDAPAGGGLRFARLTGDFTGIHWWNGYARRFGFGQALLHSQFVLGRTMACLPPPGPGPAQRLDAWLKGPVPYGSRVHVRASRDAGGLVFAAHVGADARPALVARWTSGPATVEAPAGAPRTEGE
jgi:acyl dehydratase